MIDDDASDDERAEAEALAKAIAGDPADGAPPDVVEAATLLRVAAVKGELPAERARTVYEGLEQAIEHFVQPRRSGSLSVLVGLGASLAAAAALGLYLTRDEPRSVVTAPPAQHEQALPAPSNALLTAQAALSVEGAPDAARVTFERELGAYRANVLRVLKKAYPWLLPIERAHARADVAAPDAREALAQALDVAVPREVRPEHRRVVHQDLSFRVARTELAQRRFGEALAAVDRGLALGRPADVFVGNLLVARGEALEGLGRRSEAVAAYFEALEINRKLLHHALTPKEPGSP